MMFVGYVSVNDKNRQWILMAFYVRTKNNS